MKIDSLEENHDGSFTCTASVSYDELMELAGEALKFRLVRAAESVVSKDGPCRERLVRAMADIKDLRNALEEIYKSSNQVHVIEIARSALDSK